ncbi:MAG: hypothetical protein AMXMBFR7_50560 [Planctomycetota bacterium]
MQHWRFNLIKSIQAAAELLAREPGRQMSRLRLIKLLYIADREALKETGRPITWDRWVAMKHGPVLSRFYDVIKGLEVGSTELAKYVDQQGYQIILRSDPGKGQLNRYEIRKLAELSNRYRDQDEWELVEITHQFPEWIKNNPGDSSRQIPLEDILAGVDMDSERIQAVLRDAEDVGKLQHAINRAL